MRQGQADDTPTLKWEEVYNTIRLHSNTGISHTRRISPTLSTKSKKEGEVSLVI